MSLEEIHATAKARFMEAGKSYVDALRLVQDGNLKGETLAAAKARLAELLPPMQKAATECGEAADRLRAATHLSG